MCFLRFEGAGVLSSQARGEHDCSGKKHRSAVPTDGVPEQMADASDRFFPGARPARRGTVRRAEGGDQRLNSPMAGACGAVQLGKQNRRKASDSWLARHAPGWFRAMRQTYFFRIIGARKPAVQGGSMPLPPTVSATRLQLGKVHMSDQDIQQLENQFPAVSGSAFAEARQRVLASGQSVLQSQGGTIYEVFPDGHRVAVKQVEPPSYFVSGSVFTLRCAQLLHDCACLRGPMGPAKAP